jgi:hypothetical protein
VVAAILSGAVAVEDGEHPQEDALVGHRICELTVEPRKGAAASGAAWFSTCVLPPLDLAAASFPAKKPRPPQQGRGPVPTFCFLGGEGG